MINVLTIEDRARTAGVSKSSFLRQAALAAKVQPPLVIPAVNEEQWRELARLAGNCNQMAAKLNQGAPIDAQALGILDEIRRLLSSVRGKLIGVEVPHGG